MDLKKLVSQTLQEIAEGAFEAKTLLPHKLSVNPPPADKFDGNLSADGKIICFAEFDIAIGVGWLTTLQNFLMNSKSKVLLCLVPFF